MMGMSISVSCCSDKVSPELPAAFWMALTHPKKSSFRSPRMYSVLQEGSRREESGGVLGGLVREVLRKCPGPKLTPPTHQDMRRWAGQALLMEADYSWLSYNHNRLCI